MPRASICRERRLIRQNVTKQGVAKCVRDGAMDLGAVKKATKSVAITRRC